uniref:Nuclear receptor 2C2-associated protein n=1 Tax=Oncorhynchus kisutch TaxID=8019 RepID=A0A8C7DLX5_ONCKI
MTTCSRALRTSDWGEGSPSNRTMTLSTVLRQRSSGFGTSLRMSGLEPDRTSMERPENSFTLEFPQSFRVSELKVQFQGGFSGCPKDGDLAKIIDFYPEDSSSLQISFNDVPTVHRLQIVFENSADFFGRIIVYSLDILGERAL